MPPSAPLIGADGPQLIFFIVYNRTLYLENDVSLRRWLNNFQSPVMGIPRSTNSGLKDIDTRTTSANTDKPTDLAARRLQLIQKNPWAFAWCLYAVWTILLAVFEDQASYAILGIPEFRKDFGYLYNGDYVLPASWQSAFQGGPLASRVVGALTAAPLADSVGRRNTLMIAIALSLIAITMEIVATTNSVFLGGKLLSGMAVAAIESTGGTYLAEAHRDEKALKSLHRLGYGWSNGDDLKYLAGIRIALDEIRRETEGVSYRECFRRSNLRRTIVAIAPLSVQIFTGSIFASLYTTYYAQLAGYSTTTSFKILIIQQVLAMTGNIMSWFLIDRAGRRVLTVYGTLALAIVLCIMGGLAIGGSRTQVKGAIAMVLLYIWLYSLTIGATGFTYLTEVATARLRAKTVSIGLATQSCFGLMWTFVLPYLFNPDKANLGGKVGFIFGGMSIPCFILLWCYQPETAGRSYEELDELFMKNVPARAFKKYTTEAGDKAHEAASRSSSVEAREL
ncbi:hypothetical protein H2200_008092 [Cladophialophora chaetospira]|uniref:Major facilitator superfamily (MFS) profile domain-containing protein n=1 Tax=Cladophialophora chaetospira TaxID=386627 RepID=A0AA38X747_9EURO|nr:hypothetical protein H2200_008092 [Cladophialophora chaetospira]